MEQNCSWFFYYFSSEKKSDVVKSKSPCFLLNKYINLNKNETESKMENPSHILCFSSCRSRESKEKLWCVAARKRKKSVYSVTFIFSQGIFFQHFCFISMYSVLNELSEHVYFYISKIITSFTFVAFFKNCQKPSVYP